MLKFDQVVIDNGGFELRADLVVETGEKVAVIGPSGAGKSTLIGAISGFHPIVSGQLSWHGKDITNASPGSRPVAMLFQDGNLFPHLTVRQNVGLGVNPNLRLNSDGWENVDKAIVRVGLDGMDNRKPSALSGGQQSRAALARVLVQGKPLLLLDEPFAALGPALKNRMLDLVDELVRETKATLMIVSHDPQDARRIAHQVILVDDGTAQPPKATGELLDNPPKALRDYLG